MLALQGVAPQILQRLTRHSRYSTTERFYTQIRVDHTAVAVAGINLTSSASAPPHHSPHHSQHETGQRHAK